MKTEEKPKIPKLRPDRYILATSVDLTKQSKDTHPWRSGRMRSHPTTPAASTRRNAWLLRQSPSLLLIPGTSSLTHLRENLAAAELELDAQPMDDIG
jgi:aryl-alcohol dehydrogenase-like predicted oxidoreductase